MFKKIKAAFRLYIETLQASTEAKKEMIVLQKELLTEVKFLVAAEREESTHHV